MLHGQGAFLPFLFALLVPVFVISGFDVNGTAGEETGNAARTVPRAMLTANFSTYAIGTVLVLLTMLLIRNPAAATSHPDIIKYALGFALPSWVATTFEVMAVLSLFVNMMILQLTAARVMWAQARDGQAPFPRELTRLSRERIPITAVRLLPARPFSNGRWSPLVDWAALIWSLAFCVILIKQNPKLVGGGFAGTIAIGIFLYFVMIPKSRRGILHDVRSADEIKEAEAESAPG